MNTEESLKAHGGMLEHKQQRHSVSDKVQGEDWHLGWFSDLYMHVLRLCTHEYIHIKSHTYTFIKHLVSTQNFAVSLITKAMQI